VDAWQLYGSNDAGSISSLANVTKTGFETSLDLPSGGPAYQWYQVAAVNAGGSNLGWSWFVSTNGSVAPPTSGQTGQAVVPTSSSTASPTTTSNPISTNSSGTSTVQCSITGMALAVLIAAIAVLLM
jgi:hypothetical protein